MTRYLYSGIQVVSKWVDNGRTYWTAPVDSNGASVAVTPTFWTAATGGTRITDLTADAAGTTPTTPSVPKGGLQVSDFYATVTSMWLDDGVAGNARVQVFPNQPNATADSQVAALVPTSSGSATSAALSAAYVGYAPKPTGVYATDKANLQAALDAVPATGGTVTLHAGSYYADGLTCTKPVKIVGAGVSAPGGGSGSIIYTDSPTATVLTLSGDQHVLEDFAIVNTSTAPRTAGAGLLVNSGRYDSYRNLLIDRFWIGVDHAGGIYWKMYACTIANPVKYGLYIHNSSPSPDWGDQSIVGSVFTIQDEAYNPDAGVRWESGGGLKFTGNKINGGYNPAGGTSGLFGVGLDIMAADGVTTGDFQITGNSLENCTTAMLRVGQIGPAWTGDLQNMTITGNELGVGHASCKGIIIGAGAATAVGHIRTATITGNAFTQIPSDSIYAEWMSLLVVGGNVHQGVGCPIHLGTDTRNVALYPQTVDVAGPLFQDEYSSNSLGAVNHIVHEYTSEVNAGSTYGSIWEFTVPSYCSGDLELVLEGSVVNVGSTYWKGRRYFTHDLGLCAVFADGADVQAGAVFDVQFDSTVDSTIKIQVKTDPATAGGNFVGRAFLKLHAGPSLVRKGAA